MQSVEGVHACAPFIGCLYGLTKESFRHYQTARVGESCCMGKIFVVRLYTVATAVLTIFLYVTF